MNWENVYIFISSTFNDMHAERDYLVKNVFPNLSEWCEARKLRLIDIDLRWGISEVDATQNKRVIQVCLDRIDECRPFFLCFLGQRRGWIPSDTDVNDETKRRFPKLTNETNERNPYLGNNSVTEMEILHALIDPLHNGTFFDKDGMPHDGSAVEHAFFFLRDPKYLKELREELSYYIYTDKSEQNPAVAEQMLTHWRETEVPNTGRPIHYYTAELNPNESTPEIALPLMVPTTAPQNSEVWTNAFKRWQKRWAKAGVTVNSNGEITSNDLEKAKAYNQEFITGRLGNFYCDRQELTEIKKRWADVGITVDVNDKITGDDLEKAKTCNQKLTVKLEDIIIAELKGAIAKRFPSHMTIEEQTSLQKELDQQAQFLRIAGEGFIERSGDFDMLNEYIGNVENRPFAVTAYAGMGKTSLLACWIDKYRPRSGESLHYRFIGASDDSVSIEQLVRSLLNELKTMGKVKSEIPVNSTDMMNNLAKLLGEAGQFEKTIIVIDALNQLESGMKDLYWIPRSLPERVKLVLSFKRGNDETEKYYHQQEKNGNMILYNVKPFNNLDDRKALVMAYLEQYFKELDNPRIQSLIGSDGAENPLFLKTVLSELRVFGVHNDLSEVIRTRFGNTPVSAFNAILDRMEHDPTYGAIQPKETLPHIFGWIAHSRYGMSVDELSDLLVREKLTKNKTEAEDAVYLIFRQLRVFLAKRDGRVDFFYDSFKFAATERYTIGHEYARSAQEWHQSLAEYFETLPLENRHRLKEQAWQYAKAEMSSRYIDLFNNADFIWKRIEQFDIYSLLEDFDCSQFIRNNLTAENSSGMDFIENFKYALRMSLKFLADDKSQIFSHLYARNWTKSFRDSKLLTKLHKSPPINWFQIQQEQIFASFNKNRELFYSSVSFPRDVIYVEELNIMIVLSPKTWNSEGKLEILDINTLRPMFKRANCNKMFLLKDRKTLLFSTTVPVSSRMDKAELLAVSLFDYQVKHSLSLYAPSYVHTVLSNNIIRIVYSEKIYKIKYNDDKGGFDNMGFSYVSLYESSQLSGRKSKVIFENTTEHMLWAINSEDIYLCNLLDPAENFMDKSGKNTITDKQLVKLIQGRSTNAFFSKTNNLFVFDIVKSDVSIWANDKADLYIYDFSKKSLSKLHRSSDKPEITKLAETPDGKYFLEQNMHSDIVVWSFANQAKVRTIKCETVYVDFWVLSEKLIVAAQYSGKIEILDIQTGLVTYSMQLMSQCSFARLLGVNKLLLADITGILYISDLTKASTYMPNIFHNGSINTLRTVSNKSGHVVSQDGNSLCVVDLNKNFRLRELGAKRGFNFGDIRINKDHTKTVSFILGATHLTFINWDGTNQQQPVDFHEYDICCIEMNKDSSLLLSADNGGYVLLWDVCKQKVKGKTRIKQLNQKENLHGGRDYGGTKLLDSLAFSGNDNFFVALFTNGDVAFVKLSNVHISKKPIFKRICFFDEPVILEGLISSFSDIHKVTQDDINETFKKIALAAENGSCSGEAAIEALISALGQAKLLCFSTDRKMVYKIENGTLLCKDLERENITRLTCESGITALLVSPENHIIAGDQLGRIYSLKYISADNHSNPSINNAN